MSVAAGNCIDELTREWGVLRHRQVPADWPEAGTLGEVFGRIADDPDRLLGQLLARQAAGDRLAARVVLQAMLGKLVLLAARDPQHSIAEYVTECWLQICRYPLARRPQRIAANLALDTRRTVWAGEQPTVSLDPQVLNDLAHSAGPDAITVIRNATRLGLIDRSAAACLVAVYCLGLRSHEAAQRLSISADLVRWRNARSIRRLAPHAAVLAAA
jgi:DNA-directed RNA polymerase specialized sigma24 family protein